MEKDTVIARLRGKLEFSEQGQLLLEQLGDGWVARDGGDVFFNEFRSAFVQDFTKISQDEIGRYFRESGVSHENLPRVQILETYRGSLIVKAALTMAGTMGTVYASIKAVAELPKLAEGLEELKKRIQKKFQKSADKIAEKQSQFPDIKARFFLA